jgi:hypothetical protein
MAATIPEEAMAEWSDGRLDEFALRIDERFGRFDERFEEVDQWFLAVHRRFDKVDREFVRINDRLDDLVKVLIAGFISFTGAILAGFGALVVLIATQL